MIPFLESSGGNCQDAIILVEVLAARVKLLGGSEGTAIKKFHIINNHSDKKSHYDCHLIIFNQIIT